MTNIIPIIIFTNYVKSITLTDCLDTKQNRMHQNCFSIFYVLPLV